MINQELLFRPLIKDIDILRNIQDMALWHMSIYITPWMKLIWQGGNSYSIFCLLECHSLCFLPLIKYIVASLLLHQAGT